MKNRDELSKTAEIIQCTFGLNFSLNHLSDLERGLIASAKELEIEEDIASIYKWISTKELTTKEFKILSSHLTVGETYFFREKSSLDLFIKKIIPELIEKRAGSTKHIHIWCAGCSSGEEPYSLAILIKENFPELESWNISILATDINPNAIHKALSGQYTEWSFRETNPQIKNKYFTSCNNKWMLSSEIKKMVKFSFLNLAMNEYPSSLTKTENIDIVFCRNVFIYFSPLVIREVAERIYKSLIDGGCLITSLVELNDEYFSMFTKGNFENIYYYKKELSNYYIAPKLQVQKKIPNTIIEKKPKRIVFKKEESAKKTSVNPVKTYFQEAKTSADKGEYNKAIEYIDKIISSNLADENVYYLYGTILYEQNKADEAIGVLKKGIYLNPRHLLTHIMLGNIQRQNGKKEVANMHYRNVLNLLDEWKEEQIVPNSNGMTKGRLRIMIENLTSDQSDEKR
ncbi:MAG: CheR family methyltransferase [Rikenellaceae bacterium]